MVHAIGLRGVSIRFDGRHDSEAGIVETTAEPADSAEQVDSNQSLVADARS
jgi:hypothetical protein